MLPAVRVLFSRKRDTGKQGARERTICSIRRLCTRNCPVTIQRNLGTCAVCTPHTSRTPWSSTETAVRRAEDHPPARWHPAAMELSDEVTQVPGTVEPPGPASPALAAAGLAAADDTQVAGLEHNPARRRATTQSTLPDLSPPTRSLRPLVLALPVCACRSPFLLPSRGTSMCACPGRRCLNSNPALLSLRRPHHLLAEELGVNVTPRTHHHQNLVRAQTLHEVGHRFALFSSCKH
jgi:hypothetical protein